MAQTRTSTDASCHACGDPIPVGGHVVLYHPRCDRYAAQLDENDFLQLEARFSERLIGKLEHYAIKAAAQELRGAIRDVFKMPKES